jgi:rRNA maturation RNase YbeY
MIEIFAESIEFDTSTISDYTDFMVTAICKDFNLTLISLNIILMTDNELLELNESYLNHDDYTDVITFDLSEKPNNLEGELYISLERVIDNANLLYINHLDELKRVIIHGLLHLVGYEDNTKELKNKMQLVENQYIKSYFPRET